MATDKAPAHDIYLQRVGEPPLAASRRVLVDRLWPRGVRKDVADWDEWLRDVAPSTTLRKWYGHDPARQEEFIWRYRAELADDAHRAAFDQLLALSRAGDVTLLTYARSVSQCHLPVLRDALFAARG